MDAAAWVLLGAPWDCSATGRGERDAPAALRAAGLTALVDADLGDALITVDRPERDERTGVRALHQTEAAARSLAGELAAGLQARPDCRPLVVGGDCSLLLGVLPALRERFGPTGLWFLDGHPDYADGPGSPTGETADMDLAILTGDGPAALTGLAGAVPMVQPRHTVLIGHRTDGLDPDSAAELARVPAAIRRIDAAGVRRDPAGAGRRAAAWLAEAGVGVWLHLDLDVLDPDALPAVTYPQPGGPDWDQLHALLRPMATAPRLLGASVADFRPDLDPTGDLARRIVELLARTLP